MKIYGIGFIRNGIKYGYPFIESLLSMVPLCEKLIVAVGDSLDSTREEVSKIPDVEIVDTIWDTSPRNGKILSEQTNIALQAVPKDADFVLALQGDEVFHEEDLPILKEDLKKALELNCDAIAFHYVHFYGNTNIVQHTLTTYRREVRAVKPYCVCIGDGQSYRLEDGSKPKTLLSKARVFHYGWAREQQLMVSKTKNMDALYHTNQNQEAANYKRLLGLFPFEGTHPKVMENWIQKNASSIDVMKLPLAWSFKDFRKIVGDRIEYWTGLRIGEYQSYRKIHG